MRSCSPAAPSSPIRRTLLPGLFTGPGLHAAACERVKEEMLVSEADSSPQARCGRLHCLIWVNKQTAHVPASRGLIAATAGTAAGVQDDKDDRNGDRDQKHGQDHPATTAPGSKSRAPSTGCSHVSHRPTFSPDCEPPTVHCPVTRRPNRGSPGRPGPGMRQLAAGRMPRLLALLTSSPTSLAASSETSGAVLGEATAR